MFLVPNISSLLSFVYIRYKSAGINIPTTDIKNAPKNHALQTRYGQAMKSPSDKKLPPRKKIINGLFSEAKIGKIIFSMLFLNFL